MDYIELNIPTSGIDQAEIIMAELSDFPFESFVQEGDTLLKGYIPQSKLVDCKEGVDSLLARYEISGSRYISIETQNWNAQWESNFERVEVGDKLLIRAPFHPKDESFAREVVIMPKMSFGTGHHSTTHLMAEWIVDLASEGRVEGRRVLDVGSGTGVLSIIAALEGAESVDAVDIDEWADENCRENIVVNGAEERVCPLLGDISRVEGRLYSLIVANINRNILLGDMSRYLSLLDSDGVLLMSGFLEQDVESLRLKAEELGLRYVEHRSREGWVAMRVERC